MREVIEQILDGTYDYEKGALNFSCTKLEIEICKGEVYEGSFTILATEGKYTTGYITTSDPRMECLCTQFQGNREEIGFRFHGEWMDEGEVSKGEFVVVSNKGEYYLPYAVSVVRPSLQSSQGTIKNLLQFANLAKSNWKEAVKLFYTPGFAQVLKECSAQISLGYQGLSGQEGNEQQVEEFLVSTGKKQRVDFVVSEKSLYLENPLGMVEQTLNIFKNGWGYTKLDVSYEGDFLFIEKNIITEDDFLGNRYTLPVYVDSAALHAGKNLGKIVLKSIGMVIEVPVTISKKNRNELDYSYHVELRKNICSLTRSFLEYRQKKVNKAEWLKNITGIIDRMVTLDDKDPAIRMFQAHLLITKEQYNEAGWILEHVGELMEEDNSAALESYYLYLNTLLRKEEGYTAEISWQVTKIYKEEGEDWRVAWLLLFLAAEYDRNPASKWNFLSKQFTYGCKSPLIYLEAFMLLNNNPTLLRRLGDFELQVLNYGRKQGAIGAELLEQVLYLAERVKEYQPLLYRLLVSCYRKKEDSRVLREICTLLIKGNKSDNSVFEWFAKGVEAELRITNLYEYYMMSMDLGAEPPIPKQVLLYFNFQTHLDYLHTAYLFCYVVKKEREYADIYESYYPRIPIFVNEQIGKGRVNRHLSYLYKRFLTEDMIDDKNARVLSTLLFAHEIHLKQKDIRSVIVCQSGYTKECIYPVTGERIWVPLYGKEYCILFENYQGMRLVKDVSHTIEKLMSPHNMLERVAPFVTDNRVFDLYMYEKQANSLAFSAVALDRLLRLSECPYLTQDLQAEVALQIIRYYYGKDDKKHLTMYLSKVSGDYMNAMQRGDVIRHMVLCDCMERAYEWLNYYGNCNVDEKILLQLLEKRIERTGDISGFELAIHSYRLFDKGCFSSILLQYLMEHYMGMTRDLRKIWKASKSYSMDRSAFCERVLIQLLFAGSYVGEQAEIFKEYIQGQNDLQVEHAYLTKNSYEFFAYDKLIQPEILIEVGRLHREGTQVQKACKLAYLKYYGENPEELQKEDEPVIRTFLEEMLQEGVRLKCFLELSQYCVSSLHLIDKTIVEYHATEDGNPRIHYLIMRENGEASEYETEDMEHVIGSIYMKEFILFFGESLQYYIVEESVGEDKLTQSGTQQRGDVHEEEMPGRYGMINDIVFSKSMQDYNTFDHLLEEYYKKDFYNQELFVLRK